MRGRKNNENYSAHNLIRVKVLGVVVWVCVCFAQTPQQYLNDAKFYFEKKYYQQAIILCKKAIEANPACAPAYILLGQIYTQTDAHKAAEDAFKQALKFSPKNFEAYLHFAHLYRKLGQLKWAGWLYRQALQLNPAHPSPWTALAQIAKVHGKLYTSLRLYEAALQRAPRNVNILLGISSIYFENLQDINKAKFYCKKAIKRAANSKDRDKAYLQLARLYKFEGNLHQAINQYLKITAPSPQIITQLAHLYTQVKQFNKAKKLYLKLLEGKHNDWQWYLGLARLAEKEKNYTNALKYYTHLIKIADEELVYLSAAQFLLKARKFALQNKKFQIIAPYHPLRQAVAEYLKNISDVYVKKGDKFLSYYFIKTATLAFPQNPQLRLVFGKFLENLNFNDSAIKQYRLALELEPNFKEAEDLLERALFKLEGSLAKKYDIDLDKLPTPSLPTVALTIWPGQTHTVEIEDIFKEYLGALMEHVSKVIYLPHYSKLNEIIRQNKKLNADYILLCELKEAGQRIIVEAKLYDAKTLRELGNFYSSGESKLKLSERVGVLFHKVQKYLHIQGRIIKLFPDGEIIVNLGQRYNVFPEMHLETRNFIKLKVIAADEYISLCEIVDRKQMKFIKKFQVVSTKLPS